MAWLAQQMALSWLETLLASSIPLLLMLMLMLISDHSAKADADYAVGPVLSQSHLTILACFCNYAHIWLQLHGKFSESAKIQHLCVV